ncbi:S-adenosyl-L-methionine-dependent methyltransferase [Xylariomycetidae sp. FL2044]|nr:S-adenosyl-L-methionine-dependent methyltransferase [Xylariomycetidae sp. FL2044]
MDIRQRRPSLGPRSVLKLSPVRSSSDDTESQDPLRSESQVLTGQPRMSTVATTKGRHSPTSSTESRLLLDRDESQDVQPSAVPVVVELPRSTLTQPRSIFDGFLPPAAEMNEADAVRSLLDVSQSTEQNGEYIEFELEEFSIYVNNKQYPHELRPLQSLATRANKESFYFDGVLCCGDTRVFVREIPFQKLPVGNYEASRHTVGDQIWIQSELQERLAKATYYRLRTPSPEYARMFDPYIWVADLAKHVINYCEDLETKGVRVTLHDFQSKFSRWILRKHSKCSIFKTWHAANRTEDFRGAVVANFPYIWQELNGLNPKGSSWHKFCKEITSEFYKPNLSFSADYEDDSEGEDYKKRKSRSPKAQTVVTPFIHSLFSHMVFGEILELAKPSHGVTTKQLKFESQTRRTVKTSTTRKRSDKDRETFIASIRPGDVVSTLPDGDSTDTKWAQRKSDHRQGEYLWFGLVQKIHVSSKDKRSFDIIWMYQPIDTPCGVMKYPWKNELFLSNNCTCHHHASKLKDDEIISTHSVEFFGNPSTKADYFVRQTYIADNSEWVTLKKEHFNCAEPIDTKPKFQPGDTVLVQINSSTLKLEPSIVEEFTGDGNHRRARLRRLWRRRTVDKNAVNASPNELVYSDQFTDVKQDQIFRRCLIRAFPVGSNIPNPYNRGGTGDAFYITHQESATMQGERTYVPIAISKLAGLHQGFDPEASSTAKLQGLDLFCGGGNFGRGLEDGGAIEMRWANDISKEAVHTYMANSEPGVCTPYLGSIDDLLRRALQGSKKTPQPGDVHFISGGSPCPGFSSLTHDKTTYDQRKNQSLVASFASFIDLYRPHYGILENVPQMVSSDTLRGSCVFSQLVCAIVGLGYQTQIIGLDAWSFGSPQSRSRVFLCFSAPGFRPPRRPQPSHSHRPNTRLLRLGTTSSGLPFNQRESVPTPFKFVTAREAVGDLPDIRDTKGGYCVGYPDHRLSIGYTPPVRKQVAQIPNQPYEMNFAKAWLGQPGQEPVLPPSLRDLYPKDQERTRKSSKGWMKINPNGLFTTVSTKCLPTDARVGQVNHWSQPRPQTILEARRAQGFLDHEIIVGLPAEQYRIVGNSVARQVSLALGLAIREAWFGTLWEERASGQVTPPAEEEGNQQSVYAGPSNTYGIIAGSAQADELDTDEADNEEAAAEASTGFESSPDEQRESTGSAPTPSVPSRSTRATSAFSGTDPGADLSHKRKSSLVVEILSKKSRLSASVTPIPF